MKYDIAPEGNIALIVDDEGYTIAQVTTPKNSTAHSDLEANLILFTAAPKMLKALQEIQHTIATAKGYVDFAKAWAIAYAAIIDATHTNGGTDATDV